MPREYQDFTIEVRSLGADLFESRVVEAPKRATARGTFNRPVMQKDELPRLFGERLYRSLFQGPVDDLFRGCREALARDQGLRLRLRFSPEDPESGFINTLPWEHLWDPHRKCFLSTDLSTPLVRDFAVGLGKDELPAGSPLRILVVDASPIDHSFLELEKELERLAEVFGPLVESKQVDLIVLEEKSPEALRDALRDEGVHILHLMGHGGYNESAGNGAVYLERPGGPGDEVSGVELANLLKGIPELRLVVLNACKTALYSGRPASPLNAGVASALLEQVRIPAVVAHRANIPDATAIDFSELFYGRIAKGDSVEEAMTDARLLLQDRGMEWSVPALFLAGAGGRLFNLQPPRRKSVYRLVERLSHPIRLGIRSFSGWEGDMGRRNDKVLDLTELFDGRKIRHPEGWQREVLPRLQDFLDRYVNPRRPLVLDLAAHSSIAFAAGWLLEAKSGLDIRVRQRTQTQGEREWHPSEGEVPAGPLWLDRPDVEISPDVSDLAVALSVTHPVEKEVQEMIGRQGLPIRRIIDATIAPRPEQRAVVGGAHMLRLAEELLPRLRQRAPEERDGRLHIFYAGPNALQLYLGQLARPLGRIVLYEYDFEGQQGTAERYQPSIELPPVAIPTPEK
jgi:hypothetical protein